MAAKKSRKASKRSSNKPSRKSHKKISAKKTAASAPNSQAKITIYSTPTCPYCTMAKDFLKEKKIPFKDLNVADDAKAREEMIKKSGQLGVPVIEINGKIMIGFDRESLERELAS